MNDTTVTPREKSIFVLDTNVLMHDPSALFRFQEHDVCIPMVVLEELDNNKSGMKETARNARQTSRFLDELFGQRKGVQLEEGVKLSTLNGPSEKNGSSGRIFFSVKVEKDHLEGRGFEKKSDNQILNIALDLQEKNPGSKIVLVSKDINLRIKAAAVNVYAEEYSNDQVISDLDVLFKGFEVVGSDFWDEHDEGIESWQDGSRTFYRVRGDDIKDWYPNQFLAFEKEMGRGNVEAIVRDVRGDEAVIERVPNYHNPKHAVWGISARNREQNMALNLLMDPEIDFVSMVGTAGTGKTLLALAAGLSQVMDLKIYSNIIMTRETVAVGEGIGFLPGTEEEKMTPWMGALMDNLEVLTETADGEGGEWGRAATGDLLRKRIRIHSLNFMRGRTFLRKYIILDEAQNLTPKQMKTLITRAGPGTKIVCLGNVAQIDTPYLTETTSGLTYAVDRFKNWQHSGHITLAVGERSRLATQADDIL